MAIPLNAQVTVVPETQPQIIFAGIPQSIRVSLKNTGAAPVETTWRMITFQVSSGSMMRVGEPVAWKQLTVLAGQTILEQATVRLPDVRSTAMFRVEFINADGKSAGSVSVMASPPDLLRQLSVLAGKPGFGVLDPHHRLTPILDRLKMEYVNLAENAGFDTYQGRFVIVGPFAANDAVPGGLAERVKKRVTDGLSAVWIGQDPWPEVPASRSLDRRMISWGAGALVMTKPDLTLTLALAESPAPQLDLIESVRLAVNPQEWWTQRSEAGKNQ